MTDKSRDELIEENNRLQDELARLREQIDVDNSIKPDYETGSCPRANATNSAVWKMDCTTLRFTFISPQFEQLFGYPTDSWQSLDTCNERIHSDDRQAVLTTFKRGIAEASGFSLAYRVICADGSTRWVRDVVSIQSGEHGPKELLGFMIDITDSRQVEISFRESEERYKILFEQTADYVLILDPTQGDIPVITDANEAAFRKHGYSRDEMIGQPVSMLDVQLTKEEVEKRTRLVQSGKLVHFEAEHRCKDGTTFYVDVAIQKVVIGGKALLYAVERDITEYKQTEEKLRFTQFASDHAPDCILWIDEQAHICYANNAACREHGYSRETLLTMSIPDINPASNDVLWAAHWQKLQKEGTLSLETSHQRENGSLFQIEVSANLVRFGNREYNVSFIRNITTRKQVEAEKQSHIRTLESLQKISDAINIPDSPDRAMNEVISTVREIFASDRAWLLYPCDPETDFWEVPVEATLPEYPGALALKKKIPLAPESAQVFSDALASKHPVVYCPMVTGDKRVDAFAVRSQMVMAIRPKHGKPWLLGLHQCSYEREWTDGDRELLGLIGVRIADLLSSIYQDRALRNLSSAMEQAGESVVITDRHGTIEYVNPAFTAITGYAADEAIGRDPSMLKSDAQDPAYYREMWETITRGEVWCGTLIDRKKDGSFYPALMSVAPILDDDGNITHFVATQQDMTEYKRLEEQFFEAQKLQAIGTLAGGIAHDFNNMLAAVQGNTFLAHRHTGHNPELDERLDSIDMIIGRAAAMVKQLLTYARKDRVNKAPFSLNAFIKDGFKMAKTVIPENIEHICDLCQDDLVINGDASQLQQALMNLLINARDAVADTPKPRITCTLQPYAATDWFLKEHPELRNTLFARLTVRDNGCGITHDKLNKIFEPFFTTKEVGKGTGLGLAMVYGSIKTHGGVIDV